MEVTLFNWSESRWRVLQPAIYLVSILPVLACVLLFENSRPLSEFLLVGVSVVLIQHAINVFNDDTDWEKGADTEKSNSWFHFHQGNNCSLKRHAWISLLAGVCLGIFLVVKANRSEILWVALPLVLLGFLYNFSHLALSYTRWGEWVTGICYGPGVFGCMAYFVHPQWSFDLLIGSLAFGFLAVAVLLSHQPPQILTDFAAGKMSFAVRQGVEKTYLVARWLTITSLILLMILFCGLDKPALSNLCCVTILVSTVVRLPKRLSPAVILKTASLLLLAFGLLLKAGII
jgi:1,4-dihydroxy-2-naphthoate octaprenyltransferase